MLNELRRTLGDLPISIDPATWTYAKLLIHAPSGRRSCIIGMIQNGHMYLILSPFDLHTYIQPYGFLTFRGLIFLSRSIDHLGRYSFLPRHAQKHPSISTLIDDHLLNGITQPLLIYEVLPINYAHRPPLRFNHECISLIIQHIVYRLPRHVITASL